LKIKNYSCKRIFCAISEKFQGSLGYGKIGCEEIVVSAKCPPTPPVFDCCVVDYCLGFQLHVMWM
jgi:hypothetical protein